MESNKAHNLIEAMLKQRLLLPSGMPELKRDQMKRPVETREAYHRFSRVVKKLSFGMKLGDILTLEARVSERLIVEHGWRRVDGSLIPPGKVAEAVSVARQRALNPHLFQRLKDFRLMSEAYKRAAAQGICAKILPLPA